MSEATTTTTVALTVLPEGKTYDAETGTTLLAALRRAGVLHHECDGGPKCTDACHLFVLEGRKSLSKVQREENERLDAIVGVGSKSRLACRAVLGDQPVTVELLTFV
ncbi:ferredoxin, 2Fe-2S [Variovorax sp. HW608]|uniref:2Fe-2S iron-sulfur cluster-binding protein n=1 Tax=Variovorax sp. HW608 TaxID=1034889 RepID=UPI00081F8DE4|nr:2Fe-2S iron-sulfur cluster-binding protein [Variovorax sp. HW608]SCK17982.1 ferredoxin, 2Fe-2S [Variovorax sp. HW608]